MVQDTSLKSNISPDSRRYIRSSSFVMALLFTILCGAAALSLGYFIHYFTKGHFIQNTEAVLDAETRYIEAVGAGNAKTQDPTQLYVFLNDSDTLPQDIPPSISRLTEGIIVFDYPKNNRRYAAKIHTFEDNRKLLIGTDITAISDDFKFMQWLGVSSFLFVVLVILAGYIISVFVVSGTNKIADTARDIMTTGDLSRRVNVGSNWDDLSNMAGVLNVLLDRIEELMQGVRQVSDNIAHDLRTPLTRMRSHLEALESSEQKDILLKEADQLLNTFNALLRISRIEAEKQRSQFANVDLKNLLRDVAEFYEPLAEDKDIILKTDLSEASLHGDRDLLFQAYANLLDNAVKFTPAGGKIRLSLKHDHDHIHVEISDTGSGVSKGEEDKIFNRFYRSEKCRSSAGTGLGLSLVNAVINLHSGKIIVKNADTGLTIITVF